MNVYHAPTCLYISCIVVRVIADSNISLPKSSTFLVWYYKYPLLPDGHHGQCGRGASSGEPGAHGHFDDSHTLYLPEHRRASLEVTHFIISMSD